MLSSDGECYVQGWEMAWLSSFLSFFLFSLFYLFSFPFPNFSQFSIFPTTSNKQRGSQPPDISILNPVCVVHGFYLVNIFQCHFWILSTDHCTAILRSDKSRTSLQSSFAISYHFMNWDEWELLGFKVGYEHWDKCWKFLRE